jgi:diguanylate cyclase (GGDEF)-like protein
MSLRTWVGGIFAIAIFAVAALLGGLIGQSSLDQLRARIGQSLETDASRMADRLNSEMAERGRELALLAALDPLRDIRELQAVPQMTPPLPLPPGGQRVQSMLDGLKRSVPSYSWIAITDPNGRVLVATDQSTVGTDISTRDSFRESVRGRATPGSVRPADDDPRAMDLVYPIRGADGSVAGVIMAQLNPRWLETAANAVLTRDEDTVVRREIFVLNNQDRVILGPSGPESGTVGRRLNVPAVARARAGFFGTTVDTWPDGQFMTGNGIALGTGPYPGPGSAEMRWTVLVRERLEIAFAPAYELRRTIFGVGTILAVIFAAAGWLLAGWITAPLRRIAVSAERLRQGDDVELPRIRGPAEIDSLSASLRALVAKLTRKQLALDELQDIALHDPLTGLLNRHGMHERLRETLRRVRAEESALLILIGDLDGFKAVNDTFGHGAGDHLLRQVAGRLQQSARPQDVVARLGGDEFILILWAPDGQDDHAARDVARLALASVSAPYAIMGQQIHVGCSFGAASWPEHKADADESRDDASGLEEVIEKADAALYCVKRSTKGVLLMHGERMEAA